MGDGVVHPAQGRIGIAEIAEAIAFAAVVADFAAMTRALLVVGDGAVYPAEGRIGIAEIAEAIAFAAAVADFAADDEGLLVVGDGRLGHDPGPGRSGPGCRCPRVLHLGIMRWQAGVVIQQALQQPAALLFFPGRQVVLHRQPISLFVYVLPHRLVAGSAWRVFETRIRPAAPGPKVGRVAGHGRQGIVGQPEDEGIGRGRTARGPG